MQQYVGDRAAAEDVVQQTFLAAFRTISGGTTIEHPRAWLFHVARNNTGQWKRWEPLPSETHRHGEGWMDPHALPDSAPR